MSALENKQLVQQVYSHFGSGNIPSLLALLSPDVDWSFPKNDNPIFRTYKGREDVLNFFVAISETQDPLQFEAKDFIADGDKVVVLGLERWKVKSTQKTFEANWVHVYTIKDAEITTVQILTNMTDVLAAYQN